MKNFLAVMLGITTVMSAIGQEAASGLVIKSKAPDFTAKDHEGNTVNLGELQKKGPVVVVFYRGNWCPYCNKQLSDLQDSLQYLKAKGASVVAISPEAQDGVGKTIEKTKAAFPIIYDKHVVISKAYKVAYEIDTATINKYKSNYGVDFLEINQQKDNAFLPVPAVYIIDKNGIITYRFFETDITKRASVKELLNNL